MFGICNRREVSVSEHQEEGKWTQVPCDWEENPRGKLISICEAICMNRTLLRRIFQVNVGTFFLTIFRSDSIGWRTLHLLWNLNGVIMLGLDCICEKL